MFKDYGILNMNIVQNLLNYFSNVILAISKCALFTQQAE